MVEVIGVSHQSDGDTFYRSSGLRRSRPSTSSLFLDRNVTQGFKAPGPQPIHADHESHVPPSPSQSSSASLSSSPPSTIDFSDAGSIMSTPASSGLSIESKSSSTDDIGFPLYDRVQFFHSDAEFDHSNSSIDDGGDGTEAGVEESGELSTTTDTTRSNSPLPTPTVADDTAVKQEPSRHVDYLSHDWKEEDIWASWRHIVSQRKVYGQRSRLENASWRTWAKTKNHLATVSPETLNWLKESDVTWLYGPLKPATYAITSTSGSDNTSRLSKSNSFITKKPILKKRSMSEVMLQKSLSTTSLVKQAAAAVQAQQGSQSRRYVLARTPSDFPRSTYSSEVPSRDQIDYFTMTSHDSSVSETPFESQEKRHIRFDETVEQCIAVECKDGDLEGDGDSDSDLNDESQGSDSSSDDGVIMMKRKRRPARARGISSGRVSRSSSHNGRKMVETLPATTLKSRVEEREVTQDGQRHHTFGRNWSSSRLSPSPSQETLRPSHPSRNFLLADDDDDEDEDEEEDDELLASNWSFGVSNPRSSLGASSGVDGIVGRGREGTIANNRARSSTPGPNSLDNDYTPEGMRRTPSGMFMPYDEDEDDAMAVGLFGRVSETINTAKDIAHVIWNVGWRK